MDPTLPPQPEPDVDTAPFWSATGAGELAICRCTECGLWLQPPAERCRSCAGPTHFEPVEGGGTLFSYIVAHQPSSPGYLDELPYAIGLVELGEQPGLRLPMRVVGVDAHALAIGVVVRVELEELRGADFKVPVARPVTPG